MLSGRDYACRLPFAVVHQCWQQKFWHHARNCKFATARISRLCTGLGPRLDPHVVDRLHQARRGHHKGGVADAAVGRGTVKWADSLLS